MRDGLGQVLATAPLFYFSLAFDPLLLYLSALYCWDAVTKDILTWEIFYIDTVHFTLTLM